MSFSSGTRSSTSRPLLRRAETIIPDAICTQGSARLGAFAGGVGAVTVVDEDFHVSVVLLLQQPPDSNGKDSNTVY